MATNNGSDTWVIVDSASQLNEAQQFFDTQNKSLNYLATTPEAYFALKKTKLTVLGLHEIASLDDLNKIALTNLEFIDVLIPKLDKTTHRLFSSLPKAFKPFNAVAYYFKQYLDSLSFASFELNKFIEKHKPNTVYVFEPNQIKKTYTPSAIQYDFYPINTSMLSWLLNQRSLKKSLNPNIIKIKGKYAELNPRNIIKNIPFIKKIYNNLWNFYYQLIKPQLKPNHGQHVLQVTPGGDANIEGFKKFIQKDGPLQIVSWDMVFHNKSFTSSNKQSIQRILKEYNHNAHKVHESLALDIHSAQENFKLSSLTSDFLKKSLVSYLNDSLKPLLKLFLHTESYCKEFSPTMCISGTSADERAQTIRQVFSNLKIPFVSFQHGGAYGYLQLPNYPLADLRSDFYAGYGEQTCANLASLAQSHHLPVQTIPIGWKKGLKLSLGAKTQHSPQSALKIFFPIETTLKGNMRFGPHYKKSDIDDCLLQQRIIISLTHIPNTTLKIKSHPDDERINPIRTSIETGGLNKGISFHDEESIHDLLQEASIVVVDGAFTAFLEAMALGKHVIYIDCGLYKWFPNAEEIARKTITWLDADHDLEKRVNEAIENLRLLPPPDPHTNIFLREFANITNYAPQRLLREILT